MGVKRILFLAGIILLSCTGVAAQMACSVGAGISVQLVDVQLPSNLYQFMYPCQVWPLSASGTILPWVTYPEYDDPSNTFWLRTYDGMEKAHWGGACPSAGTQVVAVCDYAESPGTLAQRGYYTARVITVSAQFAVGDPVGVVEVPSVALSQPVSGTVRASWPAVPANTAVAGYRLVRSADGLTNWATVTDTAETSADDNPGAGTWHYAVQIRYAGSPDLHVSNHGLSASITVE